MITTYMMKVRELERESEYHLRDLYQIALDAGISEDLEVIEISKLFIDKSERHQGKGSEEVKSVLDNHADSIIVLAAGALMDEYREEPTDEEFKSILNSLNTFYTKLGFVNINKHVGCYQYKETYIYNNKVGSKIINLLCELDSHNE